MRKPSRQATRRVVGVIAFLLLVAIAVPLVESTYWSIVTRREYTEYLDYEVQPEDPMSAIFERAHVRGWFSVRRWSDTEDDFHGHHKLWYVKTGFLAYEGWFSSEVRRETWWAPDGSIRVQQDDTGEDDVVESEPWRWGMADEQAPSAPDWVTDDTNWKQRMEVQAR